MSDQTRITSLEERQAELERRIAELEKRINEQMPRPWWDQWIDRPYPPVADPEPKCHVCGIVFKGVMGYVCTNNLCPSRVVYCNATPEHSLGLGVKVTNTAAPS